MAANVIFERTENGFKVSTRSGHIKEFEEMGIALSYFVLMVQYVNKDHIHKLCYDSETGNIYIAFEHELNKG